MCIDQEEAEVLAAELGDAGLLRVGGGLRVMLEEAGRQLARAQAMIAAGVSPSETAAATGFADQSHLHHFSARFGVTLGRWAA